MRRAADMLVPLPPEVQVEVQARLREVAEADKARDRTDAEIARLKKLRKKQVAAVGAALSRLAATLRPHDGGARCLLETTRRIHEGQRHPLPRAVVNQAGTRAAILHTYRSVSPPEGAYHSICPQTHGPGGAIDYAHPFVAATDDPHVFLGEDGEVWVEGEL